jgi:hypothetical protein
MPPSRADIKAALAKSASGACSSSSSRAPTVGTVDAAGGSRVWRRLSGETDGRVGALIDEVLQGR